MRRAFSLIEVTLALAIGSIVIVTSFGMLASIDRTNTRLEVRHRQRLELSRTRTILQAAITSLVIDDTTPIEEDEIPTADSKPPPPKRLDLHVAPSRGAQRLFRRARLAGVDLGEPQRFEMVLSRPPDPGGTILAQNWLEQLDIQAPGVEAPGLGGGPEGEQPTFRGAFELWPDGVQPGGRDAEAAWTNTSGMTLWWRPVVNMEDPVARQQAINAGSVPLASGLVACQWRVFSESKRKSIYDATWVTDLPSYVEFEATTNMNLHVNWVFEIVWTEGPESDPNAPARDGGDAGGGADRDEREQPEGDDRGGAPGRSGDTRGGR